MKVVFVHLSDIHFVCPGTNHVAERAGRIKSAVQQLLFDAKACFIVVTGDVAYSGRTTEYAIAAAFLSQLLGDVRALDKNLAVNIVVLPGNHDCDFSKPDGLRDLTLDSGEQLLERLKREDDSIITSIVSVQDNFFAFLAQMDALNGRTKAPLLQGYDRLYYERTFTVENRRIRFNCYNSAWMSRLHEAQAKLLFPVRLLAPIEQKCDLAVAAFHHPSLWLESNNSRDFRSHIECSADIILSGHEHVGDHYTKQSIGGTFNEYIEGALLQGKPSEPSGFNVLEYNFADNKRRISQFSWDGQLYAQERQTEWAEIHRNKDLRVERFENNPEFLASVNDPGAAFLHRAKGRLSLSDIFVYPDLSHLPLTTKRVVRRRMPSDRVLEFVIENKELLITGPSVIGKTTLAHTLYGKMQGLALVPVILNGSSIKRYKNGDISKLIDRAIEEQYYEADVRRYAQLDREQKVLIIDDFHLSRLNRQGRNKLIEDAQKRFGRIIIFASELFFLEELSPDGGEPSLVIRFECAEIKEFGYELRYKLIEKWITIDQDYTTGEEEVDRKISEAENLIKTLLGKNLVPSRPFFILSMLQALDAKEDLNTGQSAYAYFYELNIMKSLGAYRSPLIPIDIIMSFVPWVAFRMFEKRRRYLTELEFDQVTSEYCAEHAVSPPLEIMKQVLEKSQILSRHGDGLYRFSYKHVYYYFFAKYLAIYLNAKGRQRELRKLITKIAGLLYVEDYANFVLFFIYLTKDEKTIELILAQAKALYAEYEPCDLDEDIKFLGKLQVKFQPVQLTAGDARANRKEHLRELDEIETSFGYPGESDESEFDLEQKKELDDLLKINMSFRTMQILGQILRNFPGALHRNLKRDLAETTYLLGLRTMKMMFQVMEDNIQGFRSLLAEIFIKGTERLDDRELAARTDALISNIVLAISQGLIKRVSFDVGSKHLSATYEEVLRENGDSLAVALIDLSIKLEHFFQFPKVDAVALSKQTKDRNAFAHQLLCQMVRDKFYLHYAPVTLRQEVCQSLGIEFSEPKMIESKTKPT